MKKYKCYACQKLACCFACIARFRQVFLLALLCSLARFRQVFACFTAPSNYKNSLIRIQKRRCRRKHKRGNRATQRNRGVGGCIASKIHTNTLFLSLSLSLSLSLVEDGGDVLVKTAAQKKFLKYTTPHELAATRSNLKANFFLNKYKIIETRSNPVKACHKLNAVLFFSLSLFSSLQRVRGAGWGGTNFVVNFGPKNFGKFGICKFKNLLLV